MKKILSLSFIVALLAVFCVPDVARTASVGVSFAIDGKAYVTPEGEADPYINKENRTMVPIRFFANALGIADENIQWSAEKKTATIKKDKNTVEITVGEKSMKVNGKAVPMDTKAENTGDRVFIPARYIAEGLGGRVEWDAKGKVVHLLSDPTNNLARYGLKLLVDGFPYSLESDALRYTLNEMYIYPVDSQEAQEIIKKYEYRPNQIGTPHYFIWTKITLTNISSKVIQANTWEDGNPKYAYSMNINYGGMRGLAPGNMDHHDVINDPEVVWGWKLEPKKFFTTHEGFFLNQDEVQFVHLVLDGIKKGVNEKFAIKGE